MTLKCFLPKRMSSLPAGECIGWEPGVNQCQICVIVGWLKSNQIIILNSQTFGSPLPIQLRIKFISSFHLITTYHPVFHILKHILKESHAFSYLTLPPTICFLLLRSHYLQILEVSPELVRCQLSFVDHRVERERTDVESGSWPRNLMCCSFAQNKHLHHNIWSLC